MYDPYMDHNSGDVPLQTFLNLQTQLIDYKLTQDFAKLVVQCGQDTTPYLDKLRQNRFLLKVDERAFPTICPKGTRQALVKTFMKKVTKLKGTQFGEMGAKKQRVNFRLFKRELLHLRAK